MSKKVDGQLPHEHNSDEYFEKLLESARKNAVNTNNNIVGRPLDSDKQLTDHYLYEHEKERSHSISAILKHYEYSYKAKVTFQQKYRVKLFWGCWIVIALFTLAVLSVLAYAILNAGALQLESVATVITALISFVVSILQLVHIITKYCFPENDDEYIIKIVDSIQSNDLERTKENNRATEVRNKQTSDPKGNP